MSENGNGVLVFPDAARGVASGIDPNLLLALQNGGMNGGNWIWILFLWMMWQNGGYNGFRNNGGSFADLSAQINSNTGMQYLSDILAGRFDNLGQLAQIVNTSVETVKTGIFNLQNAITQVGSQVGMSGLQVQNAIASGNAALSHQLCECCCNNRLAICEQTNTLQSQAAANYAATQLQMAQIESADQLAVCQQTNALTSQAERNTNSILNAIAGQNTLITKEFCDLKERELQNKINTQGDIITQLRGQISNDKQTEAFNAAMHALDDKIDAIAAKQPNTVPVVWPNLVAANATPYVGQSYYPGYAGNGWGGNIVF